MQNSLIPMPRHRKRAVPIYYGASVAKWLVHLPFTSEAAGSSLSENFLNATRTQSSCEKSKSQRSAESGGFPPGTPVSSHRES
jgi:DMSO/TMAO reductase YedYZ molybdopterin-dependent catalytic subunit